MKIYLSSKSFWSKYLYLKIMGFYNFGFDFLIYFRTIGIVFYRISNSHGSYYFKDAIKEYPGFYEIDNLSIREIAIENNAKLPSDKKCDHIRKLMLDLGKRNMGVPIKTDGDKVFL